MEFAKYVCFLRKKRGLTQKELADALGFTPQGISRFESLNSAFDLNLIPVLCKTLGCSLTDIYTRAEDPAYAEFAFDTSLLAKNILELREKGGFTQSALANDTDITERSLRDYECGKSLPSYQTVERLAKVLDTNVDYFFVAHEIPSEETPKKSNRPLWIGLGSALLALAIVIAVGIGGIFGKWWAPAPASEGNAVATTSRYIQKYPNSVAVHIERQTFDCIGDEIEFTLYDPEDFYSFKGVNDYTFSIRRADEGNCWMDVAFESLGDGRAKATLIAGRTGELCNVGVSCGGWSFDDVFYLHYINGASVQVADTGTYISEGLVTLGSKNERTLTVKYDRAMSMEGQCFITNQSIPVSITIVGHWYCGMLFFPPSSTGQNVEYGGYSVPDYMGVFTISLPEPNKTSYNEVCMIMGTKVVDKPGGSARFFMLKPAHLYLIR